MGRIDADSIGQRTASALERGLNSLAHSTSKSPTFSVLQWMSQFRVQRPEMSTAQRMRASSMGR